MIAVRGASLLIITTLCATLWLFSDDFPFGNELTIYRVYCPVPFDNEKCLDKVETGDTISFLVLIPQQTVVYWGPLVAPAAPVRLNNCAVRDKLNWKCRLDHSFEAGTDVFWQMNNGAFIESTEPPTISDSPNLVVTKRRWWWIWLQTRLRPSS
jgi:hypothetical protein